MILLYFGDKYSAQTYLCFSCCTFHRSYFIFDHKEATKSGTTDTDDNDRLNRARDGPEIFWIYLIPVNRIKREAKKRI